MTHSEGRAEVKKLIMKRAAPKRDPRDEIKETRGERREPHKRPEKPAFIKRSPYVLLGHQAPVERRRSISPIVDLSPINDEVGELPSVVGTGGLHRPGRRGCGVEVSHRDSVEGMPALPESVPLRNCHAQVLGR